MRERRMTGKNIGYARVSTTGQTLDEQLEKLKRATCDRIFQEKLSGATRERPALAELLEFVRDGDTVYITKLDRLARNTLDLHAIVDVLDKKSAGFVVIDQPEIDTTSPIGRMLFSILGAVAAFERDLIQSRTTEGQLRARAKGVKFGRKAMLSPERLAELQMKFAAKVPRAQLAREFDIAEGSVYRLCQHVSQPAPIAMPSIPLRPRATPKARRVIKTVSKKVATSRRRKQKRKGVGSRRTRW